MIPSFKRIHNNFKLDGFKYDQSALKEVANSYLLGEIQYQKAIGKFLLDWINDKDFVEIKTSGSTGKPKQIVIKKQAMVNSALATGAHFNLSPVNTALHCLPTEFIAGKMMLVRAMVLGLELDVVEPTSNPLADINKLYDFCAMVPLQLEKSLGAIDQIKTLIVGGAVVPYKLVEKLKDLKSNIYATYGMTETVTHIAVKKLNNFSSLREVTTKQSAEERYETLSGISVFKDDRDCLIIKAPKLFNESIVTNDVVKIHSKNSFEFLGRIDNVINSGGVKLFPEEIERKLEKIVEQRFFVASAKDEKLGEHLVLLVESSSINELLFESIKKLSSLQKFEIPKEIHFVPQFIETNSGKIQRAKTLELLKE